MFGSAGRPCGIEQLFVLFQAAGSNAGEWCPGTAAELPRSSRSRTIVTPIPDPGTGQRAQLGCKANNSSFQGGCRRPPGRKANNYYQFWRLQVWALGQVIANNYSFSSPGRSGPEQKKPRASSSGLEFPKCT